MLWNSARLISLAVGGVLVNIIDVRLVYLISAALLPAAAIVGLTTSLEPTAQAPSGGCPGQDPT